MTKSIISGGCACGNVRYAGTQEPGFSFLCQCGDCQKASGTGHSAAFIVARSSVEISGEPTWYETKANSGNSVERGFCNKCGSLLLNRNSGHPDIYFINAGSLDDPAQYSPSKVVYREGGHDWDLIDPEKA